ncbi:hypothetical protein [Nitrosomonas eutropha]|uniref:hypothetical protein n=1 Tax=Nitrosomonas eutropha TaxID=916 RepID=UPI0002E90CA4|nr:hypothetical protein [Nitrosomonas eutropha]
MKAARTASLEANGNDANKEFMVLPDTRVLSLRMTPMATGTWRVTDTYWACAVRHIQWKAL